MKLNEVFKKNKLIQANEDHMQQLIYESLHRGPLMPDRVQTSTTNITEKRNIEISEIGKELKKERQELEQMKVDLYHNINQIDDDLEKAVLRYRYLQLLKWDDIAEKMNYDRRYVLKIHKKAKSSYYSKLDTK